MRSKNLFTYEKQVQKNLRSTSPPIEMSETPMLSASFVISQEKSIFKELNFLIFRQREEYVTFDEFYAFLRKLYISDDPVIDPQSQDQCLQLFRAICGQNEMMHLQEFNSFLSQDLLRIDLTRLTTIELVLRVLLEVFYNMCDENQELDLKQTLYFIKEDLHENIDFLEVMDMFGFVQDIYSGQFINQISLQIFFQKTAVTVKKALSLVTVRRLQQIIGVKRVQLHQRQKHVIVQKDNVKSDLQQLLQKNFNINFEVEVEDQAKEQKQEQFVSLLQQSRPKIRGWLQRLSQKKANKWQLLFLQIDQSSKVLRAIKTLSIKRIFQIATTEFIALEQVIPKGHHRKTNSLTQNQEKNNIQDRAIHTDNVSSSITPFSHVFILQDKNSKITIIKSWDIREIESVFNDARSDDQANYSGIVQLAFINPEPIDKVKQKFKTIVFKEHLIVIKDNKIILYDAQIKHQIDLNRIKIQHLKDLPFIPSHPFPFQIVIEENNQQYPKLQEEQRVNSVIMWQIDEDDNESEKDDKKGFLDTIYDKLKRKPSKKKVEKIIFAAESEPKRRQWIYSINYYRANGTDLVDLVKSQSNRSSFQNQKYSRSIANTQPIVIQNNQNVFVGGHTQINVFNLGGEDDYYDVFKAENQTKEKQSQHITPTKMKIHCHTDPNEHINKEQRLVTLPSNCQQTNRQIYTTQTVEIWQQFLGAFFRYLVKQKNHSMEEAQEPRIQTLYNKQVRIHKPK